MSFKPASRKASKLRLALSGMSGSGKTWTALEIAKLLTPNSVGVADSERSSSAKYAHTAGTERPGNWRFLHAPIEEKHPLGYVAVINDAARAGIETLIVDSFSHAWTGALEQVDKLGGNKFTNGWKTVSPQYAKLIEKILSYPGHLIATMRSKSDFVMEEQNGKTAPKKVGLAAVAREGTEFEFDLMFDLDPSGTLTVTKSRCGEILPVGYVFDREQIPAVITKVKQWLDVGAELSETEKIIAAIQFATTSADLTALIERIKTLGPEDRAAIHPAYKAKKSEIVAAEDIP